MAYPGIPSAKMAKANICVDVNSKAACYARACPLSGTSALRTNGICRAVFDRMYATGAIIPFRISRLTALFSRL
eukprot:scaffold1355_cov268-Pinguiococcus_pyrenoidosus.AAC.4